MEPADITPESLPGILRDASLRSALLAALRNECGTHPPLANLIAEVAPQCDATALELDEIVGLLWDADRNDDVLADLVFHPAMSERTLLRLLDGGRCIHALGHRSGPECLLLRLASEHRFPEAILTLALNTYGGPDVSEEKCLAFIRQYIDVYWLRESLQLSDAAHRMSGNKRQAALVLVNAYEAHFANARHEAQLDLCRQHGVAWVASPANLKVGIADNVREGVLPINGLRLDPEPGTTGWFIWGGEELSRDPEFFVPLHVKHLDKLCPQVIRFLGLPPGWRFLIAGEHSDVWGDSSLLDNK